MFFTCATCFPTVSVSQESIYPKLKFDVDESWKTSKQLKQSFVSLVLKRVVLESTFFQNAKKAYIKYIFIFIIYFACACKLTLMMAFTIVLLCLQLSPFSQDDVYINDGDYEIDGICFAHLRWSQAWTAWKDKKKTSRSKDSNGIKWSNFDEGKMNTNKGCSNMQHSNLYTFLHHKPLKIWVGWCIFHQPLGLGRWQLPCGFFMSPSVDRNPWRAFGNMVCSTLLQSRFASCNLWRVKNMLDMLIWILNVTAMGIHEMYSSRLLALIVFWHACQAHTHTHMESTLLECDLPSFFFVGHMLSIYIYIYFFGNIYTCYTSLGQWEAHTTCASWELAKKLFKRWPWRARSCQKAAGSCASSQGKRWEMYGKFWTSLVVPFVFLFYVSFLIWDSKANSSSMQSRGDWTQETMQWHVRSRMNLVLIHECVIKHLKTLY